MLLRLLFMADSELLRTRLSAIVETMDDVESAEAQVHGNFWDQVGEVPADLIVVSRSLLAEPVADTVASIRALSDVPDVVVLWETENPIERAKLLSAGCNAILQENLPDELMRDVLVSLSARRLERSQDRMQVELTDCEYSLTDFDSASPGMRNLVRMARRVAQPNSSVLILGETGVGKERLARSIHLASPRRRAPFIPINCAAFPEALLEGELFGYVEGAFTGAASDRRGYFELAHGGTLFLDEIGELPVHLQVKLLRVLQERTVQPLGSEKEMAIDVRIIAATNRDLEEEIRQKRFRQDLYYRLGVVTLDIPPLREHPEDIPQLLERYLDEYCARLSRNVRTISPEAMDALCRYDWPGNIRELMNVIERAVILCEGDTLTLREVPSGIGTTDSPTSEITTMPVEESDATLLAENWCDLRDRTLQSLERRYLSALLRDSRGCINSAAEYSGIKPRTLYQMMRRHGFDKRDFKQARRHHFQGLPR